MSHVPHLPRFVSSLNTFHHYHHQLRLSMTLLFYPPLTYLIGLLLTRYGVSRGMILTTNLFLVVLSREMYITSFSNTGPKLFHQPLLLTRLAQLHLCSLNAENALFMNL